MINNLSVTAIICLHFGKDWLPYAMRSVNDVVDQFIVCYSPVPNHGTYQSAMPCPETREQLMDAAFWEAPEKTRWFEYDRWQSEGEQFKAGWQYTTDDVIVKLDCDEVWYPDLLRSAVINAQGLNQYETRVKLRHYWRSMRKAFTNDPAAPGRIYLRDAPKSEGTYHSTTDSIPIGYQYPANPLRNNEPLDYTCRIQHFGYAMSVALMRYKMSIHGHKSEFKNPRWFEDVFMTNRQYDCHPIGSDYWMQTEDVDVPYFLQDHKYANIEVIA